MKKLSYLLGLFAITGLMFTSCTKDETEDPQDLSPAITFQTGADFTSSDVTINQGDSITVGVICTSNATSGKKLESFKIYMIINNVTQPNIVEILDINATTFSQAYNITFPDVLDGKLYAEITDKDGKMKNVNFNVTVEESAGPIYTYTTIMMGGQSNVGVGSFYSTGEDLVYLANSAVNNQEKIDFVFFYGTTNQYSIGAPNDDQVAIAHSGTGVPDWTIKNATKFSTDALANLNWTDVTDDGLIISNASNLTVSLANELLNGQIYAFETASTSSNAGKMGLFKVIQTTGTSGADRLIEIEVKIQQ